VVPIVGVALAGTTATAESAATAAIGTRTRAARWWTGTFDVVTNFFPPPRHRERQFCFDIRRISLTISDPDR